MYTWTLDTVNGTTNVLTSFELMAHTHTHIVTIDWYLARNRQLLASLLHTHTHKEREGNMWIYIHTYTEDDYILTIEVN